MTLQVFPPPLTERRCVEEEVELREPPASVPSWGYRASMALCRCGSSISWLSSLGAGSVVLTFVLLAWSWRLGRRVLQDRVLAPSTQLSFRLQCSA